MRPLTAEWVAKAEGDWATAQRELRARKTPNYDAACFHAQQCVEKYFKARLQEADLPFGRTHNLVVLLDAVLPVEPLWEDLRPFLHRLNAFSIEVRYPGESADRSTAREAVHVCRHIRKRARSALGLET
jgi:HEPN domain-containing protein